jgi:hypothetical protein
VRSRNLEYEKAKNPLPGCGKYNPMGCNAKRKKK